MPAGDWADTAHIELGASAQLTFDGNCTAELTWYLVTNSGLRVFNPTGRNFQYVTSLETTIGGALVEACQALANDQGIPVFMPDGTIVMPASTALSSGTLSG